MTPERSHGAIESAIDVCFHVRKAHEPQAAFDRADALFEQLLGPLRPPRHPLTMARFGLSGIRSAIGLARARFEGDRARALLDAALRGGGRDNVSVVVVAVAGRRTDDGLDVDTSPSPPQASVAAGGTRLITAVPPSTLAPAVPGSPRPRRHEPTP